jgi:hypothetical protein
MLPPTLPLKRYTGFANRNVVFNTEMGDDMYRTQKGKAGLAGSRLMLANVTGHAGLLDIRDDRKRPEMAAYLVTQP